jgi:hypothetical protein
MDLTCAVWFWDTEALLPPSTVELYDVRKTLFGETVYFGTTQERIDAILSESARISREQRFFHWELEFPELYYDENVKRLSNSGFDAIIGNPPWDVVQPNSQEFFSNYDPYFRDYDKQKALKKIDQLIERDAIALHWQKYQLFFENFSNYLKSYFDPYGILKGKIDIYRLFTLHNFRLVKKDGNLGIIIPSDFYTGEGNTELRKMFLEQSRINFLFSFENKKKLFPIHSSFKFILLSAKKGGITYNFPAQFMIHDEKDLYSQEKFVYIDKVLIEKFSPNTFSISEFKSQQEIEINSKIYSNHRLFGDILEKDWNTKIKSNEINMTVDSHLFLPIEDFVSNEDYSIMIEGKCFHLYDSQFEKPSYVLETKGSEQKLIDNYGVSMNQSYRLAMRTVASSTNQRTLIVNLNQKNVFFAHSANSIYLNSPISLYFLAILNSFISDYLVRQKVSANVNIFYIDTLPIPIVDENNLYFTALFPRVMRLICMGKDYQDLWDKNSQNIDWNNLNTSDAPLRYPSKVDFSHCSDVWDESMIINGKTETANRYDIGDRAQLRAEIDAIVAHLYGLSRDEMSYILDTFTALSNAEIREFGEFRSKRMVLEEMKRLEGCQNA